MPFPSARCQACKVRRIKCDETKPTCQNCTKSQRICLDANAVKQSRFSIHVENSYASGETKRPRGPRSDLTLLRPAFDLPTQALTYYLHHHLQTLTDVPYVSGCMSESVFLWKVSGKTSPMVDLAISALALVIYSRTQQYPPAAADANLRYCQLLRIMQGRMSQPLNEGDFDACLLVVLLMGRYEGATHSPADFNANDSSLRLRNWSHCDGAMAILKFWNDSRQEATATFIIKHTRKALIRFSLLRDLPVPDWMLDGTRFGEHDLELAYDHIEVRMVNLRYACVSLEQKIGLQILEAEELDNEARELDKALDDWAAQIPNIYSYREHMLTELGSCPRAYFYSPIVYSYSKPGYAAVWCQYFSTRMLINSTRLRILLLSRRDPMLDTYVHKRQECITKLTAMADSLASTVPFCLGRFKIENHKSPTRQTSITLVENEIKPYLANLVIWPLSIAAGLRGIDNGQRLWFRSELARLGRIMGDGIIESAEADRWLTF